MKPSNEKPKNSKKEKVRNFLIRARDEAKAVLASKDKPTLIQGMKKSEKVQKLLSIGLGATLAVNASLQGANVLTAMGAQNQLNTDKAVATSQVLKAESERESMQKLVDNFDQTPAGSEVKAAIEGILKSDLQGEATRYNNKLNDIQKIISDYNAKPLSQSTFKTKPGDKKIKLPDYGGSNSNNYRTPSHTYGELNDAALTYEEVFTAIKGLKKIEPVGSVQEAQFETIRASELGINDSNNSVSTRNLLGRLSNEGPEFNKMTPPAQAKFKSFWSALGNVEDISFLSNLRSKEAMISTTLTKMEPGLTEKRNSGLVGVGGSSLLGGILASQLLKKKPKEGSKKVGLNYGDEGNDQPAKNQTDTIEPIEGGLDELNNAAQVPEIGEVFETSSLNVEETVINNASEPLNKTTQYQVVQPPLTGSQPKPTNKGKLGLALGAFSLAAATATAFAGPNIKGMLPNIQSLGLQPQTISRVESRTESTKKAEYKSFQELLTPENTATLKDVIRKFVDKSFTDPKEHNAIMSELESQFSQEGFDLSQSANATNVLGNIASSSNVPFYSSLTPVEQDLVNWFNSFKIKQYNQSK